MLTIKGKQKKVNSVINKQKKNMRSENYLSNKLDNIEKILNLEYTNLKFFKPQQDEVVG